MRAAKVTSASRRCCSTKAGTSGASKYAVAAPAALTGTPEAATGRRLPVLPSTTMGTTDSPATCPWPTTGTQPLTSIDRLDSTGRGWLSKAAIVQVPCGGTAASRRYVVAPMTTARPRRMSRRTSSTVPAAKAPAATVSCRESLLTVACPLRTSLPFMDHLGCSPALLSTIQLEPTTTSRFHRRCAGRSGAKSSTELSAVPAVSLTNWRPTEATMPLYSAKSRTVTAGKRPAGGVSVSALALKNRSASKGALQSSRHVRDSRKATTQHVHAKALRVSNASLTLTAMRSGDVAAGSVRSPPTTNVSTGGATPTIVKLAAAVAAQTSPGTDTEAVTTYVPSTESDDRGTKRLGPVKVAPRSATASPLATLRTDHETEYCAHAGSSSEPSGHHAKKAVTSARSAWSTGSCGDSGRESSTTGDRLRVSAHPHCHSLRGIVAHRGGSPVHRNGVGSQGNVGAAVVVDGAGVVVVGGGVVVGGNVGPGVAAAPVGTGVGGTGVGGAGVGSAVVVGAIEVVTAKVVGISVVVTFPGRPVPVVTFVAFIAATDGAKPQLATSANATTTAALPGDGAFR
mmetsp:Transcript_36452/g.112315  ORF Transcript_36452/g.112315 Transcript_36452/m.112315 type:complete len:570 (+) Transcript_36452:257-1966(+)